MNEEPIGEPTDEATNRIRIQGPGGTGPPQANPGPFLLREYAKELDEVPAPGGSPPGD